MKAETEKLKQQEKEQDFFCLELRTMEVLRVAPNLPN